MLVQRLKSRDLALPDGSPSLPAETGWSANETPYFDPLEVLDHHVKIDWDKKRVVSRQPRRGSSEE